MGMRSIRLCSSMILFVTSMALGGLSFQQVFARTSQASPWASDGWYLLWDDTGGLAWSTIGCIPARRLAGEKLTWCSGMLCLPFKSDRGEGSCCGWGCGCLGGFDIESCRGVPYKQLNFSFGDDS